MLVKQKIERTNQKGRAKLLFNLNKWSGYIFSLFASCSYSFLPRSLYIIHKRRHRSSNSSSVCITFSLFRSSLDLDVCGVLLFLPNVLLHFCCCCSSLARLFVFFSSYRSIHNLLPTVNMDGDGVLAANEKKKLLLVTGIGSDKAYLDLWIVTGSILFIHKYTHNLGWKAADVRGCNCASKRAAIKWCNHSRLQTCIRVDSVG